MNLEVTGVIGRWKPLHNGGALLLDAICANSSVVKIGIGSSDKHNVRNPFTAMESQEMIDCYLRRRHSNYEFIHVPDFGHIKEYGDGQMWRKYVKEHFGSLDSFVTGNDYVRQLLENDYDIVKSYDLVPANVDFFIKGSIVRMTMAAGGDYEELIPPEVASYLQKENLVGRFRHEFGLETIAKLHDDKWRRFEDLRMERLHTLEV
jgi:nicotinamide mononucleotide adenylyltransferase